MALLHVEADGVRLESADSAGEDLLLGRARHHPFHEGHGAWARIDDAGHQVLLDQSRGTPSFKTHDLETVMESGVPVGTVRGRVVLLGTVAPSVKDLILTPFQDEDGSPNTAHGVEIHAQVVDQLLRRALDGEPAVWTPEPWLQTTASLLVALFGAALGLQASSMRWVWVGSAVLASLLVLGAWLAVPQRVWFPVGSPLLALASSTGLAVAFVLQDARRENAELRDLFSRHVSQRVLDELWRKREQFVEDGRIRTQRMMLTILMADLQG